MLGKALEALLESNELAHAIVDILDSKKAANILMMDMHNVTLLADYYVLCDGSSTRQIDALSRDLMDDLKKAGAHNLLI